MIIAEFGFLKAVEEVVSLTAFSFYTETLF